jgi:hypothetical protein
MIANDCSNRGGFRSAKNLKDPIITRSFNAIIPGIPFSAHGRFEDGRSKKGELGLVFANGAGGVENHGNLLSRVFWPIQIAASVVVMKDGLDDEGKAVKVPDAKYSLHALRHAAAALWIEQGLGPKRIQTLMGHASIQQTFDQYGYRFEARDDDQTAMAEIEARLLK